MMRGWSTGNDDDDGYGNDDDGYGVVYDDAYDDPQ